MRAFPRNNGEEFSVRDTEFAFPLIGAKPFRNTGTMLQYYSITITYQCTLQQSLIYLQYLCIRLFLVQNHLEHQKDEYLIYDLTILIQLTVRDLHSAQTQLFLPPNFSLVGKFENSSLLIWFPIYIRILILTYLHTILICNTQTWGFLGIVFARNESSNIWRCKFIKKWK